MSIVHDHTLLTDFAAYIHALGGEDTSASIIVHIDDFLAARQPPGEPPTPEQWARRVTDALAPSGLEPGAPRRLPSHHGIPRNDCAECDGGSSPEMHSDPYCVHGNLPANGQCPLCAEMLATPPAPAKELSR